MKTTKFISALIAIFAIAFLSTLESCKKDETTEDTTPSKTELLSSEGWVVESAMVDFGGQTIDMLAFMDECEKDDILKFVKDLTIISDAGAVKCDPSDPQTEPAGTWAFTSNETKIQVTEDGDIMEMSILALSSSELKIEFTEYDSTLQSDITGKFTYKH